MKPGDHQQFRTRMLWKNTQEGKLRVVIMQSIATLVLLLGNVSGALAVTPSLPPTSPPLVSFDECKALPVDTGQQLSDKASCLKFYALQKNDETLCRLSDELDKSHNIYNCGANQAVRRSVYNTCIEHLQASPIKCAQFATLCPDIDYFGETTIDQCLDAIALHEQDDKWCQTKECFYALSIRDDDPTTCNALGQVKEGYILARDICLRDMAKKHNNPDTCNSITEESQKQICLRAFVSESNNSTICNRLPSAPQIFDLRNLIYPYSSYILPLPVVQLYSPHYSLSSYHYSSGAHVSKEACNLKTPFFALSAINIVKRLLAYGIFLALAVGTLFSLYKGIRIKPSLLVLLVPPLLWLIYAILYVPGIFRDVPGFGLLTYNLYMISVYITLPYFLTRYFKYLQIKARKFRSPS